MGHSRVRIKARRRKVAALAAYSRQFTVKNVKKGISEVVNHKRYGADMGIPKDKLITNPYTGHEFVMVNPHPIHGEKYDITVTGYDWVPIEEYKANIGLLWEHKKHPQPKRLHKKYKKKYYFKGVRSQKIYRKVVTQPSTYAGFKNFPYTLPKMNKIQYMEKLMEYKLVKWERKNPCPEYSPDLFYSQEEFNKDVEKWKHERENMKERFRDFVVSIYDKLHLTGRFVVAKDKYTEEKVAEIKDVDGEGHHINDLPKTSKLIKKAQKITNEVKSKRQNLVATNLKDHKKQKGRIILPQAA